jgi:dihydropteroate synthase
MTMFPSRRRYTIQLPTGSLSLGERCLVMGILNVTPDSFADDSPALDPAAAIDRGLRLNDEGADIIDIGGESTRPGTEPVSGAAELSRVLPVVKGLARRVALPISVDTYRAEVARAAVG